MAHIKIKDTPVEQYINTDHVEYVEGTEDAVCVKCGKREYIFRGEDARRFMEQYQRLCIAHQRPEVG